MFIQRYFYTAGRQAGKDTGFFCFEEPGYGGGTLRLRAPRGGFDLGEFDARFPRHAPRIVFKAGRDPGRGFVADADDTQDQRYSAAGGSAAGAFLQVVGCGEGGWLPQSCSRL